MLLAGCERQPNPRAGFPSNVGVVLVNGGSPWWHWDAVVGGARAAGQRYLNLRIEFVTSASADPNAEQLISDALGRAPRVVAFVSDVPPPADRFAELRDRVARAGAAFITADALPLDESGAAHVFVDMGGGAEALGRHLDTFAGGGRSYLLFHEVGTDSDPRRNARRDRFLEQARSVSSMQRLNDWQALRWPAENVGAAVAALDLYPHASLLVSLDATVRPETLGAGHSGRRWALLGATPDLWPRVYSGEVVAVAGVIDGEIGSAVVELAAQLAANVAEDAGGRSVLSELVTRGTLDDFARRYAEAAGSSVEELWPGHVTAPRPVPTSAPHP
jgi:hypothetical protein